MIRTHWTETCPACNGMRVQRNIQTGMNERCKMCGGTGRVYRSNFDDFPPGVYCQTGLTMTGESNHHVNGGWSLS